MVRSLLLVSNIRVGWENGIMKRVLHILRSEPDETVIRIIEALSGEESAAVVNLYEDKISGTTANWLRLVDDIFDYDQVICW